MARKDISDFDVVNAVKEYKNGAQGGYGTDILARLTNQPLKVAEKAFERADRRGLLSVGISLRTASLTVEGERLYQAGGGKLPPSPYIKL